MLKMAAADGITHLVATPHSNYKYAFRPDENRVKLQELQKAVGESPKLMLGCDFHLHYENIRQLVEDRGSFTINQGDYVLVEFGDQFDAADQSPTIGVKVPAQVNVAACALLQSESVPSPATAAARKLSLR